MILEGCKQAVTLALFLPTKPLWPPLRDVRRMQCTADSRSCMCRVCWVLLSRLDVGLDACDEQSAIGNIYKFLVCIYFQQLLSFQA